MGKTFHDAMTVLIDRDSEAAMARRPGGPILTVSRLGQITMHNDCLYLGDLLDLTDWIVEEVEDVTLDYAAEAFQNNPNHVSAITYLTTASGYAEDEMIGRSELDAVRREVGPFIGLTAPPPCPHCDGLGAFPATGDTCDHCLGGGEVRE